jgi:hypothetical protein
MGITYRAELGYGYHLRSEKGWLLDGPDPEGGNDDPYDYESWATRKLLASAGLTDDHEHDDFDEYLERRQTAMEQIGVTVELTGYEGSDMLLVAGYHKVALGDVGAVPALDTSAADAKLAHALDILGIRPRQQKPQWLLASYCS